MAFGVSKKIPGFIQAFRDYEKKNRQVDRSMGHVWPSVRMGPDTKNNFLYFFSVEFYCGHFKPIPDEQLPKKNFGSVLVKSAKSSTINFDPTPTGSK